MLVIESGGKIVPRTARLGANWLSQIEHRLPSYILRELSFNYLHILSEDVSV